MRQSVEVLAAAHRIGEMDFPVVALVDIGQGRGNAALRHHRVRFAKQALGDNADANSVADASIAALNPAPPAPITSTS